MRSNWWKAVVPLLLWIIILLLPAPAGLNTQAWHYAGLFTAVILGLILEPIPAAAIGFIGVTLAMVLGYIAPTPGESIAWGVSGFSNTTVWLIFGAFILSMGYQKSGLGRRIALYLVKLLGKRTLGLGYAVALADLALAPATPSNTARSAGTIYPIISNIPGLFGSEPGATAGKIGSYIMWTAFATTAVTSSLFLTALAPNPLALSFVRDIAAVDISWGQWFLGFLPVGIVLFVSLPLLVYILYPPEIKTSREAPSWASGELEKMGPVTFKESVMAALVILALILWIFGGSLVHTTAVVWVVISLMIITGILDWDDILNNQIAWNMLVWFATLVALAAGLKRVGFLEWAAENVATVLGGFSPLMILTGLIVFFFLIHYFFASLTAHTTAIMPVLLTVGIAIPGIPRVPFVLLLCYAIGLMGVLTPYATGPGPVYYGSGYISRTDFWRLGLIFGMIFLVVLLGIGIPYLTYVM
ncbi:MAG TPA: anion permease [bacterium]|nr:anion permease [bacterium]